jgi:hypothetical protein
MTTINVPHAVHAKLAVMSLSVLFFVTAHASDKASRVSAIYVPGAGQVLKAQLDANGTIHLLIDSPNGPQYVKSTDGGINFTTAMAVVDPALPKPGLKFSGADLAVGKDGRVHVAMSNNAWKLKLPQEEWSLYYATLSPGAKAFSTLRNLNRKPSEGFSLAADERGNVTACFLSNKLFAMVSHDNGETFGPSVEINPAWNPCDCCTTTATYGADGRLAILYREETSNERDMFVVLWDQSGAEKPLRKRVSSTLWNVAACPMTYFAISQAGTGYVIAWPTKGQVYFARLDKNGEVLPPGEIRTPGTAGMRTGVLALGASDGTALIAWKSKDELGWQLYDNKGLPQGEPGSATSPGGGAAGVILEVGPYTMNLGVKTYIAGPGRFLVFP